MNKTFMKIMVRAALAASALTIAAHGPAFAQSSGDDAASAIVGAWNVEISRVNCQTSAVLGKAPAMLSFNRGGTMSDSGTQISPSLRSPSQGAWRYESGRQYTAAFQFFRFNVDGTLAGRQVVRQHIDMTRSTNQLSIFSTAQVLDVNGSVVATICSTAEATRFE